jgi:ADP-ribose pyrophosphatase
LSDKKWKVIKRKAIFQSKFLTLFKDSVRTHNGNTMDDYFLIKRRDFVIIVATDSSGRILTKREYRHGSGEFELSLPAGMIEKGDSLIDAARRELREETGITKGAFKYVGVSNNDASRDMHKGFVIRVTNAGNPARQKLEKHEIINKAKFMPAAELKKLILSGKMREGPSLAALMLSGIFMR